MNNINPYALGATLYVPAVKDDLLNIVTGRKYPLLRSVVICLEDAISDNEVEQGLANLQQLLLALPTCLTGQRPLLFVRPRNVEMAIQIIASMPLSQLCGFVLPKFDIDSLNAWNEACRGTDLLWMPTLETAQAHDAIAMRELAIELDKHDLQQRIIALRIGGNDLLSCLGVRRMAQQTLYEGPLAYTISMLVSTFSPRQYALSAPVFERLDDFPTLQRELQQDLAFGLVGKTAIHPSQLLPIQNAFRVPLSDYQAAMQILNSEKAVYKWDNVMAEPATHKNWAGKILLRAEEYGVLDLQSCRTELNA
ncbi:HpcH/HpaI aldolase/citrate lyase family protein [Psychromonas sp. Urea-02u-13]|uniref:HpcH/HpaI aldolase/citrate lyase family protein n=1 Tax=Psychromonas sp. Urea-02u-13 TaxID=2058326 RepID=UPI000C31BC70|nr:HpcH/HpaI aldolase/citrate lyase family protein [Psychromonas sp. Urea-02u-13]PKG39934.1 citrate lyase subunit beta [Psychromonas sp. Urea-02u-13]